MRKKCIDTPWEVLRIQNLLRLRRLSKEVDGAEAAPTPKLIQVRNQGGMAQPWCLELLKTIRGVLGHEGLRDNDSYKEVLSAVAGNDILDTLFETAYAKELGITAMKEEDASMMTMIHRILNYKMINSRFNAALVACV